ncbi:hypothetical protein GUJ93_ZPchr0004g40023 [Zizania palustris]|uniref:GRAM domain-containing protein n=1 Tax=Zizania palustris TaxID=103762 RepID=A0A8J5SLZ6_ZIZPA|nr:hypothetical protein GUJ93_ZPchr0004g40023 [Zizania palustris]
MISNGGHVIGVPVTSKAYGIEEVSPREPSFRKVDADHLEAVRVRDAVRLHCTKKIAFRSDRPVAVTSPNGDVAQVPYRVVIPLMRIAKVRPSENVNKPEEKYIQVVTVDGFEFWFMGFVSYQRSCKYMQQAISELQ